MNYYIKINTDNKQSIDEVTSNILFRLYIVKQGAEFIPYDIKELSQIIKVGEDELKNAIELLHKKKLVDLVDLDQKFAQDVKNLSKFGSFLDTLNNITTKYISSNKEKDNDNIYYTKDNNFTIDNTTNLSFFKSINLNYKELTKERIEENNLLNLKENTILVKEEKKDFQEVFDYYNTLGLKKMRTLNEKTTKAIKEALKTYTKEKLFELMRRFKCIVKDEFYYYNYEWNAEEFFCRKEGYKEFDDNGSKWLSYLKARPIVKTNDFFEQIWEIYPNHNNIEEARKEYQNKFIGLKTSAEASQKADEIYEQCADYLEDADPQYIMSLSNWLRSNIKNGVFKQ